MENFVLYEQVGQGDHCTIYKGRRKDTINFLSIHCADKCKRPEITNMVRLMHEINHKNIVCFYEWYETTNHIWLIVELCTGGSLEKLISEDGHLPETCIRKFGVDLVNGLHQIHSVGIVFSDIKPSKILFNGPGDLKYADFGLSRLDGENLDQLLESYMDGGEGFGCLDHEFMKSDSSDIPKRLRTRGTPTHMAPEVLMGEEPSFGSDFWSLGCVFYEMFAGHPPFMGDSFQQLQKKIFEEELGPVRLKGSRINSGKPSAEFQSLLDGLLERDPRKRMNWPHLVSHPFWQGELKNLVTDDITLSSELRESFRQSIASFSTQMSFAGGCVRPKQAPGQPETLDDADAKQETPKEILKNLHNLRSDLADSEPQVLFTISARPCTARGLDDDAHSDELLTVTCMQKISHNASPVFSAREHVDKCGDQSGILSLIFHTSDFQITSIIDMAKQSLKISLKYDVKALSVHPCQAEKLMSMSSRDQESHLVAIMESVNITEKGPTSQKQIQLFNYIGSICSNSCIANALVRRGIITLFSRQVKDAQQLELKTRLCFIIATIASNVTELDPSTNIGEAISILTEAFRDGFRVPKIKLAILPALGEILFLVTTQEENRCAAKENWSVPSLTCNLIIKCLNEGEEPAVYQFAIKIIENVATRTGHHAVKFVNNEVAQQLWQIFLHSNGDTLRIPSLSALARLSKISASVIQNVFSDKVGVQKLLSALSTAVTKIQQAAITIIAVIIVSSETTKETKITQDKFEIMNHAMRMLESPSVVIRAKAFLVITFVITGNRELLLAACQNRLVMYVERDRRKQAVGKVENAEQAEYLNKCLDWLMLEMIDTVPQVSKELLTALDSVLGRKHLSSTQVKQLKNSLPLLALLQHLISSNVFRSKIVSESFIKNLASFLGHILGIETGVTQIQPANGPDGGREEFIHTVFAIVENVVQHPSHVIDHAAVIVDCLLPSLSAIVSSCTGETRTLSLRIFSEIVAIFVNHDSADSEMIQRQTKKLDQLVIDSLLPQFEQILLDQDPLPLHGLKLLLALVEQHPAFIKDIEQFNLIPVFFQVLVDHQSNPVCSTMQQVAGLFNSLVTRKETNMRNLYDHGFVEHFTYLFHEVSSICLAKGENNSNTKATSTMLLLLLETFHGTLKYISDVVRRALEIKKGDGDSATAEAEQAETLLLINKPLTEFVSPLTQLLIHEDIDISDTALKCLAQLLQFFGGEHANSLSAKNMECYSEFLKKVDLKKQKIVLRLIKRLIATDAHQLEMMKLHGSKLAATIKIIEQNAGAKAEIALSTLATEILKAAGYKN